MTDCGRKGFVPMSFLSVCHTDIGLRKKTNQDAALMMQAQTDVGDVLLSVICDGMGGLSKGEVASATLVDAFRRWFKEELPKIIHADEPDYRIFTDWENIIMDTNRRIADYAAEHGISMGTTLNAILFMQGQYYIVNVGDSRAYSLTNGLNQLTSDQSFVQREIDSGRMTPSEAAVSPQRSVLLQCVGASEVIEPAFHIGDYAQGQVFMQCSDGFRNVLTPEEMYHHLNPEVLTDEKKMQDNAVYLTQLIKSRRESDNITVLLVKVV